MGFPDKFKRKKVIDGTLQSAITPVQNTMIIILFDKPDIGKDEIEKRIAEKFGKNAVLSIDSSHPSATYFMLHIDDADIMCSYMPFPCPGEECDILNLFRFNHYISEDEQKAFVENKSFCVIAETGGGKTLAGKRSVCLTITRLCGSLLNIEEAAGVYNQGANLLLGKNMYLYYASISEQEEKVPDYFPSMLWILVYQTRTEDGTPVIETCGLEQFGFPELQFYNPKEEWAQSYEKLYIMSALQITGNEFYKNMDTISFTPETVSVFKQNGKKLAVIGGI